MFVGKLRTSILMLSKGEVLLERAHLGSLLSIHRSEELDLVKLDEFLRPELLEVE